MSFMCTLHSRVTDNSNCHLSYRVHEEAMSVVLDFDPDQQGMLLQVWHATSPAVTHSCPSFMMLVLCITNH